MSDLNALQRKKRGQIATNELDKFDELSDNELINNLTSKDATTRTCAATILGKRKSQSAIPALCKSLKTEKALYTKIAISEALGKIGEPAIPFLIELLGKIGNNQHTKLPDKPFAKWNYPLPRDIVARTITKIGQPALSQLIDSFDTLYEKQITEAIDAIGFISFYSSDDSALPHLLQLVNRYADNNLILWKVTRSLQSFPHPKSIEVLEKLLLGHSEPAIRWEAARSFGQICQTQVPSCFLKAEKDADLRVQYAVQQAKDRITTKLKVH